MFAEFQGQTVQRAQDRPRTFHLLCIFFILTFLVILLIGINCELRNHWAFCQDYQKIFPPLIICAYLAYVCEWALSETHEYFRQPICDFQTYMRQIKSAVPIIGTRVECYHYKTIPINDEDELTNWKVIKYSKSKYFDYSTWEDTTGEVFGFGKDFIQLVVIPAFEFGNEESARKFEAFQQDLTYRYRKRDKEIANFPIFSVEGHRNHVLVQRGTKRSFFLHEGWYLFFSLCLLSWPYRMWLESVSERKRIVLRKVIYA